MLALARQDVFAYLRRRATARVRVFAFSAVLGASGLVGALLLWQFLVPGATPLSIPWPIFAVAYYVAEVKVIDVHFRGETHSFSLSEVPAVIGLFFVDPRFYIVSLMLGALAALITVRQPTAKIAFNLSYFLLGSVVSLAIFHAIAPPSGPPGAVHWVAAFAGTQATSLIGAVSIAVVIGLSGGGRQLARLPQMLQVGALFAATNTSLALLAVAVLWVDPAASWLVAVPVVTMFLAYRAYLSERQKHESLELLYESSRIFQRSVELDSAIVSLLQHARLMFRCERAETVVYGPDGVPLRTTVGPGELVETMVPAPEWQAALSRLTADPTAFVRPAEDDSASSDRLFRYAMTSPLRGESGLLGAMLVGDRIGEGDEFTRDDLRLLETVANQAAVALENGRLEQSLAELFRLKEELRHQAYHDPLTGLANRVLFLQAVVDRLSASDAEGTAVLLFLDLDDFKVVNDTVGHGTGDLLLQLVAQRLLGCTRAADVAARLGGDEFAILTMDRSSNLADARQLADRIAAALNVPFLLNGREFTLGTSIGIAGSGQGQGAEELLRNADVAMYDAKTRGKAQTSIWDPGMHRAVVERHEMRTDLARAVERRELEVHYQPLVALESGAVVGFEALSRWNHPTLGPISPDRFVQLAEEDGTIVALGRRVLRQACEDAVRWQSLPGLTDATVAVNLSSHQVIRDEFSDEVEMALADSGLDPRLLVLEMTETAMFRDMQGAVQKLQSLRTKGIRLAVDDFGTGYSSLRYLREFRIDELKIAREFIAAEDESEDAWVLAHAMVMLGRTLGLTIVAEGVETDHQRRRLLELGCHVGQGFLFSRAVRVGEVASVAARLHGHDAIPTAARRRDPLPVDRARGAVTA